jgi:hypothetical protein
MIVRCERPPLFEEIDAAFHIKGRPIIFAWGTTIFNPLGGRITPELMAHESVHGFRQGTDIEGWWRRYIADETFRLEEEIPAHVAEYQEFCKRNVNGRARNNRRLYLHHVASRLASPLYGKMVSYDDARRIIKNAQ